ncbi:MAG: protein serine/threonine phosphatase 2C family protein [Bacteriovoracaceae bacterium]|nr:protein serine/threonine phosphatase 2C family protein [Bacteriovoracaceae bacterium]
MSDSVILQSEKEHMQSEFKNGLAELFSCKSHYDKPNQDCLGLYAIEGLCKALVVSDGMGGHQGGERASRMVCETIKKALSKELDRGRFLDAIEKADQEVKGLKIGAGATFTGVLIEDGYVQFFNCGDSVSYLFGSRGKIKYRTIEHSPLGYGIESGLIPHEQSEEAGLVEDNIVSNGVGFEPMRIELSQKIPLADGDIIALMSDGVSKHFRIEEIASFSTSGNFEERIHSYIKKTEEDSETYLYDDNSLILFKYASS